MRVRQSIWRYLKRKTIATRLALRPTRTWIPTIWTLIQRPQQQRASRTPRDNFYAIQTYSQTQSNQPQQWLPSKDLPNPSQQQYNQHSSRNNPNPNRSNRQKVSSTKNNLKTGPRWRPCLYPATKSNSTWPSRIYLTKSLRGTSDLVRHGWMRWTRRIWTFCIVIYKSEMQSSSCLYLS